MSYICVNCGRIAHDNDWFETDNLGNPYKRECESGGNCQFITMDEHRENQRRNYEDDYREDMRLFNGK